MALINTSKLPKVNDSNRAIASEQAKARDKVVANPFGNMSLGIQNQQSQQEQVQTSETSNIRSNEYKKVVANSSTTRTASGKTLKRTKNGNTYSYEDVFDHRNDVIVEKGKEAHYDLRMPQEFKEKVMAIAKSQREKTSFNQLILRAIREYISK